MRQRAFAADAVSRLTGKTGVAAVTAGPGVTNAVTAVTNARIAQLPLVLLGGAVATVLKGRGALQDIDQLALLRSVTKWSTSIKQNCDVESKLDQAFKIAREGIPGPVFVECPIDLLYPEEVVKEMYRTKPRAHTRETLRERIIRLYLKRQVEHLFRM